jgi:hypothetical protein
MAWSQLASMLEEASLVGKLTVSRRQFVLSIPDRLLVVREAVNSVEMIKHAWPTLDDTAFCMQCLATCKCVASDFSPTLHRSSSICWRQIVGAALLTEEVDQVIWSVKDILQIFYLVLRAAEADRAESI